MSGNGNVGIMRKILHSVLCAMSAERARLRRTLPLLVLCAHCWLPLPVQAADESQANLLFVEAVKLIQVAEEETAAMRKFELLKDAKRKLETIVDRHPSSRLAVELISGQRIGTVSLPGLVDAIEDAAVLACPQAPTPACLLSLAVVTAEKIKRDFVRSWTLADIAEAQAKAGYIVEALATAKAIEDAYERSWALARIAEAQVEKGDVEKAKETLAIALATAKTIEDAKGRSWALARIAEAQVEKGDVGKAKETLAIALATAEAIENALQAWRFGDIAAVQAKAGYIVEAFATAATIKDAEDRAKAFVRIAVVLAESN